MKPKILPLTWLLAAMLASTAALAQDKIITLRNDTIACRIISISDTHIRYELPSASGESKGKFIPIAEVASYVRGSASVPSVEPTAFRQSAELPSDVKRPRFEVALFCGGAQMLASTTESELSMQETVSATQGEAQDFYRKLTLGFHTAAELRYMLNKFIGLGLRYSLFASESEFSKFVSLPNTLGIPSANLYVRENIYLHYVAPSLTFNEWLGSSRKFRLSEEVSLGYAYYRDEARLRFSTAVSKVLITSGTVGWQLAFRFDYFPLPWLSVGASAGAFGAVFSDFDVTPELQPNEEMEDANALNIELSLGVKFHF
jgi:hypothetical protein